jgi:hypothetical protein
MQMENANVSCQILKLKTFFRKQLKYEKALSRVSQINKKIESGFIKKHQYYLLLQVFLKLGLHLHYFPIKLAKSLCFLVHYQLFSIKKIHFFLPECYPGIENLFCTLKVLFCLFQCEQNNGKSISQLIFSLQNDRILIKLL